MKRIIVKRIIVAGVLVFAALALLAPGLIGYAADARHRSAIEQLAAADSATTTVEVERFERGWFASTATYRIALSDPRLARLRTRLGMSEHAAAAALVVDSRIAHGPFGDGLRPVLATVQSDLSLHGFGDEPIELPGGVDTILYLTGAGRAVLTLQPAQLAEPPDRTLEWGGGRLELDFNRDATALELHGEFGPLQAHNPDGTLALRSIELQASQQRSSYGLWTGPSRLVLHELQFSASEPLHVSIERLSFGSLTAVGDSDMDASFELSVQGVASPQTEAGGLELALTMRGLDAAALAEINRVISAAALAEDPDAALEAARPALVEQFSRLAASGAELDIERLELQSREGTAALQGRFELPQGTLHEIASLRGWLTAVRGSLRIEVDRAVVERAATLDARIAETVAGLVAARFLTQSERGYLLEAEYENTLLTVNGNPLPVPLPVQ